MMDFIRVSAKTVEDAITEASIQLETSSDNIEYEIVDRGSKGLILGIGSKPAVINARKKECAEESFSFESLEPEITKKEEKPKAPKEVKEPKKREEKKREEKAVKQPVRESVKETKPAKEPKQPERETVKREPADKKVVTEKVTAFLDDTFKAMGMQVKVEAVFDEDDTLNVELSGPEMGILIGKRGQTLDSIQYLTSLVANKGNAAYVRVKVDTENYRKRRRETLENLARNIASKVRRTKKPIFLEPMNPYERRIIHSALQNNPYVSTHSEGEEPYRKVVVTLKK